MNDTFLNIKFPKFKVFVKKIAKPFTLITVIIFLSLVFYSKFHFFPLLRWVHWIGGNKFEHFVFRTSKYAKRKLN